MSFPSGTFLLFFAVVFATHWALPAARLRKLWLLAASYYFYMSWNVELVFLVLLSTLVDYAVGLVLEGSGRPRTRKLALLTSLAFNLGLLGYFKFAGFFVASFASLATRLGLQVNPDTLEIILPVGISFYTFQTLSYTIDVYRRRIRATRDLPDFALFVAFFPQLVAGPIVRASQFLPQLLQPVTFDLDRTLGGLRRVAVGLAKKIVLADSFALVANDVFATPESFGAAGAWFGVVAFALQIYCDFSAYSDIAIGAAATLGYDLPENFDHPYAATSIREFWRRWHMTLSTWLRDYVYIPLGGSRRGPLRTRMNLFVAMVLGGLWHGAAWTFVAWGAFHGVLVAIQHALDERSSSRRIRDAGPIGALVTFLLICLGCVLFRAETLGDATRIYASLLGLSGSPDAPTLRLPVLWLMLLMALVHAHVFVSERRSTERKAFPMLLRTAFVTLCFGCLFVHLRAEGDAFIYFQF